MDFDAIADAYARNRRVSEPVISELRSFCPLSSASKVLEVGCGTANHIYTLVATTGCAGWGIEPSEEMRRHAPIHGRLSIGPGSAESIPFEDVVFDLLFSVDVIHHVPNLRSHLRESFRVLRSGGWICTVTDSSDMIRRREPLSRYWPSSAEADIGRYPAIDTLLDGMRQVGFTSLSSREIKKTSLITDATPYREKAFSCLRLIGDPQFKEGLQQLENDLREGPVQGTLEYVCVWGKT